MTLIEKVIAAERERNIGKKAERRSRGQATGDEQSVSGILRTFSTAELEEKVMETNRLLPALDDRRAVTAYKMLRTRVLQRLRSNNWRSLIVTGAGPGEGKTTTACNLAVSVSRDVNQAVVLIDLDLQRPKLASYFGLEVKASIGDYLRGEAELSEILYAPTEMDRLIIIPNRDPLENSSELLASPRMRTLLDWLNNQGSETISIFDMPPVLSCDDVLAFAPYADALLMVVAEGKTDRVAVSRTMELLADRNLLGVVLNQSREAAAASSYY